MNRSPLRRKNSNTDKSQNQKRKVSRTPSQNKLYQKNKKFDGMCVDQICSCGRHECPKNKYYKTDFGTTYQKTYHNFDRMDYDKIQNENDRYQRLHRSPLNPKSQTIQNLTEMKS